MTDLIDRIYFEQLAAQRPEDICKRAVCAYDDSEKCYRVTVWEDVCQICPGRYTVSCIQQNHEPLHPYFELFAMHYLLSAKSLEPVNQWISEKDIPGGATFFRGPHAVPADLITARFGDDISAFQDTCKAYGGTALDLADAAFCFQIAPRIVAAVLYWKGDEDFPAEAKLLYDQTIADHLALDVIYAMAVGICKRLGKDSNPAV
ncbi:MAG: DUF3786 domain-containing protein [Desulfosalsimonas sp.]